MFLSLSRQIILIDAYTSFAKKLDFQSMLCDYFLFVYEGSTYWDHTVFITSIRAEYLIFIESSR